MTLTATSLASVFLAIITLLFNTSNVTLSGTAELRLEGSRFKSVDAAYVQDGSDSFWQLKLTTPLKNGTERTSGHTIICNEVSEYEADIYVMSFYEPGTYRCMVEDFATPSLVTPAAGMQALAALSGEIVSVLEPMLPAEAVTVTELADGNHELRLTLAQEDIPPLMNAGCDVVLQGVIEHLLGNDHWIDFDYYARYGAGRDSYVSTTEYLLNEMTALTFRSVDVTFVTDAEDRIVGASGTVALDVATVEDGILLLEIDFDGTISEYGTSHVEPFDPEAYGVELAH